VYNVDLNQSTLGNRAHQLYPNEKLERKLNSKSKAKVDSLVSQR